MESMISIGERLREERESHGFSQGDVAKFVKDLGVTGATRQSQSKYEKGEQQPGALYLVALRNLGFDVSYVLFGRRALDMAADVLVKMSGSKGLSDAVEDAIARLETELRTLRSEMGMPPARERPTPRVVESYGTSGPESATVIRMETPSAPAVSREDVIAMAIDAMYARGRAMPSSTVMAIADSIMALQRGGIGVDKSTIETQLRLVK